MTDLPFSQRFGLTVSEPILNDVPETAMVAIAYLLRDLWARDYIDQWDSITTELARTGRRTEALPGVSESVEQLRALLADLHWTQVYTFCERVYENLLTAVMNPDYGYEVLELSQVQAHYTREVNQILVEENLGYQFRDGRFQRRGRPQTQKSVQHAGKILGDPRLHPVRRHFMKAQKFFNERPEPDCENCVKEAACALEMAVEILASKPASKDFSKVMKQLRGKESGQIPPPIAEGMIKLHGYRGGGEGVAHANPDGLRVEDIDAELVLSVVAAYITYLYDLYPQEEDVLPF